MSATQERKVWGDYRGHEAKECDHCQQWFFPPFAKAAICYPCWKRSQAAGNEAEALRERISALERELAEERENAERNSILLRTFKKELADIYREYGDEIFELRQELQRAMVELLDGKPKAETIPSDMLRRLLHLCHPDKHQGSEAATIATRWLLEQRESRHG